MAKMCRSAFAVQPIKSAKRENQPNVLVSQKPEGIVNSNYMNATYRLRNARVAWRSVRNWISVKQKCTVREEEKARSAEQLR